MEKFNVEVIDFPRQEIEAENAQNAAWEYCDKHQMEEQMIKNGREEEYISVLDEKGQETEFKAKFFDNNLGLIKLKGTTMTSVDRREIRRQAFNEWDAMQLFSWKRTERALSRHASSAKIYEAHKRAVAKFLRGRG